MADTRHRKVDKGEPPAVDIFPEDSLSVLTLTGDDDTEIDFYEIAVITYEDCVYALLQPVDPPEGFADDEAVVMRVEPLDDENDSFVPVDDEDLVDTVFALYLKKRADLSQNGDDAAAESADPAEK